MEGRLRPIPGGRLPEHGAELAHRPERENHACGDISGRPSLPIHARHARLVGRALRHARLSGRGDAQWSPSCDMSIRPADCSAAAAIHHRRPSRDRDHRTSQDAPAVHQRRLGRQRLRRDDRGREPGRRHGHRARPGERRQGRRPGGRGRRHGLPDVAAHDPAGPQPDAPAARRRDRGAGRGVRPARVEERRQARRRGHRGDPGRRRQPALLRRRRPV